MKLDKRQRAALTRLQAAARAAHSFNARSDQVELENALADVIAEARLVAEMLGLDRERMTDRVNARITLI